MVEVTRVRKCVSDNLEIFNPLIAKSFAFFVFLVFSFFFVIINPPASHPFSGYQGDTWDFILYCLEFMHLS